MDVSIIKKTLDVGGKSWSYYSLPEFANRYFARLAKLPYSIRILLEGVLRNQNGREITQDHVQGFLDYDPVQSKDIEMPFMPARVLLQDFTGVPCVVDLAAMRSAVARAGKDPELINPRLPVDLVIDHSVNTDFFGEATAFEKNVALEFERNRERYELLRWAQKAFRNFTVIPPASGICHQVNLERLAKVVQSAQISDSENADVLYFDTLVGTDSHTTMINGLGVLGWGVGGIEAEAAMLGQPVSMLIPSVVGVRVHGKLPAGSTATDAVLYLTQMLRKHGVVNKIVEFFGPGLQAMAVPERATLANMAPEYGATAGFFPVDQRTLEYLYQTGRDEDLINRVEAYCKAQGMFRDDSSPEPEYQAVLDFDLASIKPCVAGPKRPQDRIALAELGDEFRKSLSLGTDKRGFGLGPEDLQSTVKVKNLQGVESTIGHGAVLISSITSCTNTSSPDLMICAALLAKKANERGLKAQPWVKTSFAPGSVVVSEYLQRAGLMEHLEALGFHLAGYGCMTCIGNSGNLPEGIASGVEQGKLVAAAVLSGNRNFEGRVNPHTRANFLASPPLCVAFALAGTVDCSLPDHPLGTDASGSPVYLADLWPDEEEIAHYVAKAFDRDLFSTCYAGIQEGGSEWQGLKVPEGKVFDWNSESSYVQEPPFFMGDFVSGSRQKIDGGRCLAVFGDSITTDHISPAGNISKTSPAGAYLMGLGVEPGQFNSYGSRRGNDRVMTRGTFANIRLRNLLAKGREGGVSIHFPDGAEASIFDVAMQYKKESVPLCILAGKDYGMGSSRDWAAKGVRLLGVQFVVAESYERIHRSNLVGMGVLPLEFLSGQNVSSLGLDGSETYSLEIPKSLIPKMRVKLHVTRANLGTQEVELILRLDSLVEVSYYVNGGILQQVLASMIAN